MSNSTSNDNWFDGFMGGVILLIIINTVLPENVYRVDIESVIYAIEQCDGGYSSIEVTSNIFDNIHTNTIVVCDNGAELDIPLLRRNTNDR